MHAPVFYLTVEDEEAKASRGVSAGEQVLTREGDALKGRKGERETLMRGSDVKRGERGY